MAYHGIQTYTPYPANPNAAANARPSHDTSSALRCPSSSPTNSRSDESINVSTKDTKASATAESVPASPASNTKNCEGATLQHDGAHANFTKQEEASNKPVPEAGGDYGTIIEVGTSTILLEDDTHLQHGDGSAESPVKAHEPAQCHTPTLASANDVPSKTDDDLPESPIKPHLIPRPGAPTPGRGRTLYLIDDDSDVGDCSLVVAEDSDVDDVLQVGQGSFTCDDSYDKVPPLDRANLTMSTATNALDLALSNDTSDSHSTIEWLNINSRDDVQHFIINYYRLSLEDLRDSLEEAIEDVNYLAESITAAQEGFAVQPIPSAHGHTQAMDIDLDAVFGGQGATDLGDDDAQFEAVSRNGENDEKEDLVLPYASDLLARRAQGLRLSEFIPTGEEAINAICAAFNHKWFEYDLKGAKLAAAEAAYVRFSQGLDTLKRNGLVSCQGPAESKRMLDWSQKERDSVALSPYDPRSSKLEMLRYAIRKPKQSVVSSVDPSWQHYNFFGQTVDLRSTTPATVSLLVQLRADPEKLPRNPFSREGVILSQANKYIDPVAYDGPLEFLSLRGTAFKEQTTGYVLKLNDREGYFGDLFDGETVFKEFEVIRDHFLANDCHITMQRPCLMDYEGQAYCGQRDRDINEPAPTEFFRKRNGEGKIVHWILPKEEKPSERYSKLWMAQSVDDADFGQPSCPAREQQELSEGPHELSVIADEEEQADTVLLQEVQIIDNCLSKSDNFQPVQVGASAAKMLGEDVPESGYFSEGPEAVDVNVQREAAKKDVEEYYPLNPYIPGQQRVYEECESVVEEISEEEIARQISKLLEQTFGEGEEVQQQSGDSASEKDFSDEDKQRSSRATTPPCIHSVAEAKLAVETAPTSPSACEPAAPAEPEEEEEEGLSKYAFGYAACMFGIGWVLSMW